MKAMGSYFTVDFSRFFSSTSSFFWTAMREFPDCRDSSQGSVRRIHSNSWKKTSRKNLWKHSIWGVINWGIELSLSRCTNNLKIQLLMHWRCRKALGKLSSYPSILYNTYLRLKSGGQRPWSWHLRKQLKIRSWFCYLQSGSTCNMHKILLWPKNSLNSRWSQKVAERTLWHLRIKFATYIAGETFVFFHKPLVVLVNLQHLANSVGSHLSLKR